MVIGTPETGQISEPAIKNGTTNRCWCQLHKDQFRSRGDGDDREWLGWWRMGDNGGTHTELLKR